MGKLVPFEKRERAAGAPAQGRRHKAQILIFTGVRYERDADDAPTRPTATPRAKRKRG